MVLPELQKSNDKITMLNAFLGVNKNIRIKDSEFSDMTNMTNDYYPTLANRKKRGIIRNLTKPQGMLGGKYLSYVDNNKFYYDENFVCNLPLSNVDRQMVAMGAYIVIFPDCISYNTHTKVVENLNNEVETTEPPVFTLCKIDGTNFTDDNTITSATEPEDKTKYWLDTSADPVVLKLYSESLAMWQSVGTTYVKIAATGIGVGFSAYDSATISGVDKGIPAIYNNIDFNTTMLLYDAADDYVMVAGLINKTFTNSTKVKLSRKAPTMDYVCEHENRIYGCSSENHEIYACKLGDPKNWQNYAGLDSDSYAATVGTQTDFTGCADFQGYVYFFKEDGYHKLFGHKPSNFELTWKPCNGIQKGSEKSLAILNDYLVYKSREGIQLFSGTTELLSDALGTEPLYEAVGGVYRSKYYVSMRNADYEYHTYVYDITKQTWCIEDDKKLSFMAYANGGMYAVNVDGLLYCVNEEKIFTKWFPEDEHIPSDDLYAGNFLNGNTESDVEWQFVTGDIGMDSPYQKYIKRIDIRVLIEAGAFIKVELSYDSAEDWTEVISYYATTKRSFLLPIPVARCDHMKLRVSGKGEARIFSIAKVTEEGSDET